MFDNNLVPRKREGQLVITKLSAACSAQREASVELKPGIVDGREGDWNY